MAPPLTAAKQSETRPRKAGPRKAVTPTASAGCDYAQHHRRPRTPARRLDRDPRASSGNRRELSLAPRLLRENKVRSRRRTIAPSVVQGLVSCAKCSYAFSRTSTQTSARKIHYYKCIGSDSWRKLGCPVCDNRRFVRQELLDQIVWAEVIRLLTLLWPSL